MQSKLREEREAKRATMDGRHDYILSTVSERLGMSIEDAEEFMLEGEQVRETSGYNILPGIAYSKTLLHFLCKAL